MSKLLSMLGLARRAGKLQTGYDAAVVAIREGTAHGVVIAGNLSEKSEKNIRFEAGRAAVPVVKATETIEEISHAIGKKAGITALMDKGFFTAILNIPSVAKGPENQSEAQCDLMPDEKG